MDEGDLPYLWAAYRKGMFDRSVFPEGMARSAFVERLTDALSMRDEVYVGEAQTARGRIPVGVIVVNFYGGWTLPHVDWFPWSSDRNKLEVAARFIETMRRTREVVIVTSEIDVPFYERLAKYKIVRRAGTLHAGYGEGKKAAIFEGMIRS